MIPQNESFKTLFCFKYLALFSSSAVLSKLQHCVFRKLRIRETERFQGKGRKTDRQRQRERGRYKEKEADRQGERQTDKRIGLSVIKRQGKMETERHKEKKERYVKRKNQTKK